MLSEKGRFMVKYNLSHWFDKDSREVQGYQFTDADAVAIVNTGNIEMIALLTPDQKYIIENTACTFIKANMLDNTATTPLT